MKSKTLVAMAVTSTIGWSAAAFAGAGHEVMTPFSPNESGDPVLSHERLFGSPAHDMSIGATASQAGGMVTGSSRASSSSGANDRTASSASSSFDDSLAAGDVDVYSDYYVVGWTPAAADGWDYYVIDYGSGEQLVLIDDADQLALTEQDVLLIPTHELALIPSASDPEGMTYELAWVPISYDDMFAAGFSSDLTDETGE